MHRVASETRLAAQARTARCLARSLFVLVAIGLACTPTARQADSAQSLAASSLPEAQPPSLDVERRGPRAPPAPNSGCRGDSGAAGEGRIGGGGFESPYLVAVPEGYGGRVPTPLVSLSTDARAPT